MAVSDAHVFPGFLTPVLTQLFFPKPPTTFFTCFCRGERRKYAGKKSRLNQGSNSQPPGHESDMLTTEPPRQGEASELEVDEQSENRPSSSNTEIDFVEQSESRPSASIYPQPKNRLLMFLSLKFSFNHVYLH